MNLPEKGSLLKANSIPLERYAGNSSSEQNLLDAETVQYWLVLNTSNFFLENFTEAIICAILLFSGYEDIFLTLFAIPTIVNASVRFLKIVVPLLIQLVLFFFGYVSGCVNFLFSDE